MPIASGSLVASDPATKMWQKYLSTRVVEERNNLVVHYSHLVHTHAARLSRKLPAQVSYDEICSAAFDGLIEAIEAYDPERKAKFETFCQQRISGAVMDWLRSLDPQSRTVRTFEKRKMLAKEALTGIEEGNLEDKYRWEQGFTLEAYTVGDSQESRDAFVQKRDAKF